MTRTLRPESSRSTATRFARTLGDHLARKCSTPEPALSKRRSRGIRRLSRGTEEESTSTTWTEKIPGPAIDPEQSNDHLRLQRSGSRNTVVRVLPLPEKS